MIDNSKKAYHVAFQNFGYTYPLRVSETVVQILQMSDDSTEYSVAPFKSISLLS